MSEATTTIHAEHEHPQFLQHHFTDMGQQLDATKIGMWLFLVTEVLLFGGLFVGYGIMRAKHPEAFMAAHHQLNRTLGTINTMVLLISSFTMVMGVWAAQTSRKKLLILFLVLTLLCAAGFLGIKFMEYQVKFEEGLLPGSFYTHHGDTVPGQFMFFSFYFMMTGLHGVHVVLGMCAIGWLLWRAIRGDFDASYYGPVDLVGLYWHLVDMIWIYLFPLMYLIS